jgi:hypothetical protein
MTDIIPLNVKITPAYLEAVRQTIARHRAAPDFAPWDDEDEDETITSFNIEEALRDIAIACGGTSFTDWVRIVKIVRNGSKRMSDDLIYDLKRDDTLPENFDSLDHFRGYLRMEGACIQAMRVTRPVWKRYQYWLARRRKVVRS